MAAPDIQALLAEFAAPSPAPAKQEPATADDEVEISAFDHAIVAGLMDDETADAILAGRDRAKQEREQSRMARDAEHERVDRKALLGNLRKAVGALDDIGDATLWGWAERELQRNGAISRAWQHRRSFPEAWTGAIAKLAATLGERLPQPSEDPVAGAKRRLAARAAGRTSTGAYDPREEENARVLAMDDRAFAEHVFRTTKIRI